MTASTDIKSGRFGELDYVLPKRDYSVTLSTAQAVTEAEVTETLARQGGVCATCRESSAKLEVDFHRETGAVRGVLCHDCNAALGLVGDDPIRLSAMVNYLRAHRADGL